MSSKRDIWVPIYIADFIADTAHLDAARSGCYLLWIMHYWRRGPLSGNLEDLAAIGRLRGNDAPSIAQAMLDEFFTVGSDGLWHQKRLDLIIIEFQRKSLSNKEKASKAARERWKNHKSNHAPSIPTSTPQAVREDMLEECQSHSSLSSPLRSEDRGLPPPPPFGDGGKKTKGETAQKAPTVASGESDEATGHKSLIDAAKGHQKKIAPGVTNGLPLAKPSKSADPRHNVFRREIEAWWQAVNPQAGRCPWDGSEGKKLEAFLASSPDFTLDMLKECLKHRSATAQAGGVVWTDRPRLWIERLTSFLEFPIDRYGKPLSGPRKF